jgi:hypothetical protein
MVRCRPITKVFGPRPSWADRSSRRVSRAVAGPPPIGVVRRPFKEPPLTAESGGATRAALFAMTAHRGTGSSNPLPSAEESVSPVPSLGGRAGDGSGAPSPGVRASSAMSRVRNIDLVAEISVCKSKRPARL